MEMNYAWHYRILRTVGFWSYSAECANLWLQHDALLIPCMWIAFEAGCTLLPPCPQVHVYAHSDLEATCVVILRSISELLDSRMCLWVEVHLEDDPLQEKDTIVHLSRLLFTVVCSSRVSLPFTLASP